MSKTVLLQNKSRRLISVTVLGEKIENSTAHQAEKINILPAGAPEPVPADLVKNDKVIQAWIKDGDLEVVDDLLEENAPALTQKQKLIKKAAELGLEVSDSMTVKQLNEAIADAEMLGNDDETDEE